MITVNTDGLCEPINPGGIAAYGWVAYRDGEKIGEGYKVVAEGPEATNNVAEYSGIIAALKWLLENNLQDEEIDLKSDSQLCIFQLNGFYQVKSPRILPLYQEATELLGKFPNIKLQWVPREENEEADALSRKAKEEYKSKPKGSGVISKGDDIYVVASESRADTYYTVDIRKGTCSCPHHTIRRVKCKHIKLVERELGLRKVKEAQKVEIDKHTLELVSELLDTLSKLNFVNKDEVLSIKNKIDEALGH